jgi:hypothetical protein
VREGGCVCPFCGAEVPRAPAVTHIPVGSLSRAAIFAAGAAGVTLGLADCGGRAEGDGTPSSSATTISETVTTSMSASTSTASIQRTASSLSGQIVPYGVPPLPEDAGGPDAADSATPDGTAADARADAADHAGDAAGDVNDAAGDN